SPDLEPIPSADIDRGARRCTERSVASRQPIACVVHLRVDRQAMDGCDAVVGGHLCSELLNADRARGDLSRRNRSRGHLWFEYHDAGSQGKILGGLACQRQLDAAMTHIADDTESAGVIES